MSNINHSNLTNDPSNGALHNLHSPGYVAANVSALNAITTAVAGDLAFVQSTNNYYVFFNSTFNLLAPLNNTTATTNPTSANDNTQGYSVGSLWFNTIAQLLWTCVSAATGAAVWDQSLGDVIGPASATNQALPRFNGTTGTLLQNSQVTLDNNANMTFPIGGGITNISTITCSSSFQLSNTANITINTTSGTMNINGPTMNLTANTGTLTMSCAANGQNMNIFTNFSSTLQVFANNAMLSLQDIGGGVTDVATLSTNNNNIQLHDTNGMTLTTAGIPFLVTTTGGSQSFITNGAIITIGAVSSYILEKGAKLTETNAISNLPTGGNIGVASGTVDVHQTFTINQTTASQTITLPNPTVTTAGRLVYVMNIGSVSFTMYGITVTTGNGIILMWNGSAWSVQGHV